MTTATINISSVITVIKEVSNTQHSVLEYKMNDFSSIIKELSSFDMKGTSKPAKLEKYKKIAAENGFVVSAESIKNAGFDGKNSDVVLYRISFNK